MKSQTVIMVLCWIALILDWTTEALPHPDLATAMIWAWGIMWIFGMFKRENIVAGSAKLNAEDERSQRQIDFMNKLEEGKNYNPDEELDEDEIQARIYMRDEEGNESFVIIKPDGTVETEGDPDPDVVQAAEMLKDAIKTHGPEAIAEELGKQIEKIKSEKK